MQYLVKIICIKKIPEFWNECRRNGVFAHLISIDTATPKGIFGLFGNYDNQRNEIEYSIMAVSDQERLMVILNFMFQMLHGQFLIAEALFLKQYKMVGNILMKNG